MIQQRSDYRIRARVIAGNNILNALFMVGSALLLMALYALELSFPQIFALLSVANAAVAIYIYTVIPEFLLRFVAWIVASLMYRMKVIGRDRIPLNSLRCIGDTFTMMPVVSRPAPPGKVVRYRGIAARQPQATRCFDAGGCA